MFSYKFVSALLTAWTAIVLATFLGGCDGSEYTPKESDNNVLFTDMNESELSVFEQLGFERDVLLSITKDDLDIELTNPSWDLYNWMSSIPDSTKLNEIIMPGSHDAGMSCCDFPLALDIPIIGKLVDDALFNVQSNLSVTQDQTVYYQLDAGTRFFDIRLEFKHNDLRTYHRKKVYGIDFGCSGQVFTKILQDCFDFLNNPRSRDETIILKLSHFHDNNTFTLTKQFLLELLSTHQEKFYCKSGLQCTNLAETELKDLRGKIVLLVDTDKSFLPPPGHYYSDADVTENDITINARYKTRVEYPMSGTLSVYDEYANSDDILYVENDQLTKLIKVGGLGQPYLFLFSPTRTFSNKNDLVTTIAKAMAGDYSIRLLARGLDKSDMQKQGINWRIPIHMAGIYSNGINLPNIVYYDYVDAYWNYFIIQYNFRNYTWPKPPVTISDRYKVAYDNIASPSYIYSINQTKVMYDNNILHGVLSFKNCKKLGKPGFYIDKIDWKHPLNYVQLNEWTKGKVRDFYQVQRDKLTDFKLEKSSPWTDKYGNKARLTKLPKSEKW